MKLSIIKKIVYVLPEIIVLLIAWLYLHVIKRSLLKKNIWLIMEKNDEARDNGYHFYKYLKSCHPEINAYYVIKKESPDYHKVESLGNVVEANSFTHCVLFLAARFSINSQPYGAHPFKFNSKVLRYVQILCNSKQKIIFLQHGVIKDGLSSTMHHDNCKIDLFICSAKREFDFVRDYFGYPEENLAPVGLCRFDNLQLLNDTENIILIMPTWRMWLKYNEVDENTQFLASEYYSAYSSLLSDKKLQDFLIDYGYKVVFYLHYQLQKYSDAFKKYENNCINIATREEFDVQELLKNSKVLITDYSSVFFDFAYMKKPIIYYQFDREKFFTSHYAKGYFSYDNDGFGDCSMNSTEVVSKIIELVSNNCVVPDKYANRVEDFFLHCDDKNCQRTFDAIINLE